MEREKVIMEQELVKYKEEIECAKDALEHQEFIGQVLIDKMQKVEEDSVKFAQIATEAREEVQRFKETAIKTEEDKLAIEKIVLSFEERSRWVQNEVQIRSLESNNLKTELNEAIFAERLANRKLSQVLDDPKMINDPNIYPISSFESSENSSSFDTGETLGIAELKYKIKKDQMDYIARSGYLNEQMILLRQQMESLKIREMMSLSDIQHEEKVGKGENKYSTINKVKEGTTKNRIAFFEEL